MAMHGRSGMNRRTLLRLAGTGLAGSMLGRSRPPLGAQAGGFVFGFNLPWFAYGHDFGANAWGYDGISTGGWTRQPAADGQGFHTVRRIRLPAGEAVLSLSADLQPRHPARAHGEVYVNLESHAPLPFPGPAEPKAADLDGALFRVRLLLPRGSAGRPEAPNGVQVFCKTRTPGGFPSWYSAWRDIDPSWEGRFEELVFRVSDAERAAFREPGFDARTVSLVGLKLGTNDQATDPVRGDVYLDSFAIERPQPLPPLRFEFDRLPVEKELLAVRSVSGGAMNVARIFVFADGRASPNFGFFGLVSGLSQEFYDDFQAMLDAAQRAGVMVMPVLFDFYLCTMPRTVSGVQLGGRSSLVRIPQYFLDNALVPLLERFGGHPSIHSWDIMNEPEWVMTGVASGQAAGINPDPVTHGEMRDFVRVVAEQIHRLSPHPVTVGSARRMWLDYWRGLGIDFYQFHWYDHFRDREPFPWAPYEQLGLDKPAIVGEVPTARTAVSFGEFTEHAQAGRYSGVFLWSSRARDDASDLLAALTPRFETSGLVNAATQASGGVLAPDSWASLYGINLTLQPAVAREALTEELGDTTVSVTDSTGAVHRARLSLVSPGQINFLVPAATAPGPATVTVTRRGGPSASAPIPIARLSPGIFTANMDGRGAPAGFVVVGRPDGTQDVQPVFQCDTNGRCVPAVVHLGGQNDQAFLVLFGTGIRGRSSPGAVVVKAGTHDLPPQYAGPQVQYEGLDQVNARLPRALAGAGTINVAVVVDGASSNIVQLHLRQTQAYTATSLTARPSHYHTEPRP